MKSRFAVFAVFTMPSATRSARSRCHESSTFSTLMSGDLLARRHGDRPPALPARSLSLGGFMPNIKEADEILQHARPLTHQRGYETQPFGHLAKLPIALEE